MKFFILITESYWGTEINIISGKQWTELLEF